MKNEYNDVCVLTPKRIAPILFNVSEDIKKLTQEIRFKPYAPVVIGLPSENIYINEKGQCTSAEKAVSVFPSEIEEMFSYICQLSVYTHTDELKKGFITAKGGHRVGVAGSAVIKDGVIEGIKDISTLNIRISRDIIGCADKLITEINKDRTVSNTLILSPPGGGKTTILRDIARSLSYKKFKVCVIDERSEICSVYKGIPQHDIGIHCDVLDGYPKGIGIIQALRTLSPEVIFCDEIGSRDEVDQILQGMNSGVSFILTAHAGTIKEALNRKVLKELIDEKIIEKLVLLYGKIRPGEVCQIVNTEFIYNVGETELL
ncbi:MAG: spoIIIAA [Clostridia bacterium]|nr:spoIIIAA [Clostridia bacterium]